jgi:hypothetical protein
MRSAFAANSTEVSYNHETRASTLWLPKAIEPVVGAEAAVKTSGLEFLLLEFVNICASLIAACAQKYGADGARIVELLDVLSKTYGKGKTIFLQSM